MTKDSAQRTKTSYYEFGGLGRLSKMMVFVDRLDDEFPNRACQHILDTDSACSISETLQQNNFHRARFVGAGSNVVVLGLDYDIAVRLRAPPSGKPNTDSDVESAISITKLFEQKAREVRMDFVYFVDTLQKRVSSGQISKECANEIVEMMRVVAVHQSPQYLFWDYYTSFEYSYSQIGFLPDNTPIIVDMGAIVEVESWLSFYENNAYYHNQITNELEELQGKKVPAVTIEGWDGKWVDESGALKTARHAQKVLQAYTKSLD